MADDTTQASEASMPCLPTDDEAAAHDRKRKQQIEEAITIVTGPGGWYVVEVPGRRAVFVGPAVEIHYGPLESKEAAEFARRDTVKLSEGCCSLGWDIASEVWNVQGRILCFLRDHEGESAENLATQLSYVKPWVKREDDGFSF